MDPRRAPSPLEELPFLNRFVAALPGEEASGGPPREVLGACYSRVRPRPARAPRRLAHSDEVLRLLGLDPTVAQSEDFAQVFAGNRILSGMDPYALCYGGHQFGHWAGQLGDGRAINLGEVRGADGRGWILQLKGAGPTPYSRTADGLAVVRSSVREFLCSEAMAHLGVPTTRALSLIATGDEVLRDMFYDGNARLEPGAVVCRVSRSFTRFGSFEIHAARGEDSLLRQLADTTLRLDYPELDPPSTGPMPAELYVEWARQLARRTREMVVHWMRVGFVHGVMNTDNMSILGETIDYGPYGWLEDYDPNWTPNTTDATGRRYRFGAQPAVAHWNLVQWARAVVPLFEDVEPLREILEAFPAEYQDSWRAMMASKLGLLRAEEGDAELFDRLLALLAEVETDMTIFFRRLAALPAVAEAGGEAQEAADFAVLQDAFYDPDPPVALRERHAAWRADYRARLARDGRGDDERRAAMNAVNPHMVLRNYLAQLAIDQTEQGEPGMIAELLDALRRPYDEHPTRGDWTGKRPDWARHRAGCSMLSCSS